jgi:hypothetical protein
MPTRTRRLAAMIGALTLAGGMIAGCSTIRAAATWNDPRNPVAGSTAQGAAPLTSASGSAASASATSSGFLTPAYDVTPLLHPSRKYFGVEINGAPDSITPAKNFASWLGTKPNLIGQYVGWGTSFDAAAASNAWSYGAMDFVVWEPWTVSMAQIASGASDTYITNYATAVRALNVPVAISFGHEFNGNWYPWGTTGTTAAQFVAAWKHVHDLFAAAGATNVIWIWDPNDIFPVPDIQLGQFYPGDGYVDWVGVTGYWSQSGPNTYSTLYLPTLDEIRGFTRKPFIIAETAVQSGSDELRSLSDLFATVEQHSDILGFVWYDYDKGGDWRVENRPTLMSSFRDDLASSTFGFNTGGVK